MFNSLANKISLTIATILLVGSGIFALSNYSTTRDNTLDMLRDSKHETLQSLSMLTREYFALRIESLENVKALLEKEREFTPKNIDRILEATFPATLFDELFVGMDHNGHLQNMGRESPLAYVLSPEKDNFDARTRKWYQEAKRSGISGISAPYITASASKELVISIFSPSIKMGSFLERSARILACATCNAICLK